MYSLVFSKTTTAINKQIDVWLVASGSDTLATDKTPRLAIEMPPLYSRCVPSRLVELQNYPLVSSEHKALGSYFYRNKMTHFFKQKYQHPETLYNADQ